MYIMQPCRDFLTTLSPASAADVLGTRGSLADEGPPSRGELAPLMRRKFRVSPLAAVLLVPLLGQSMPAAEAQDFSAKEWPMWLVSSAEELRSPTPPADNAEELRQLKELTGRTTVADVERIAWWNVGGPVYRWNQIAIDELLDHGVNTLMATRHLALMHAAMHDATVVAWDSKLAYGRPRPSESDSTLKTALPSLPSPSYPSDFAAATTAAAEVLAYVFPDRADVLRAKAEEAMRSREMAGLEFPSDVAAGRAIGAAVAGVAIERGKADGSDRKWTGTVPEGPGKWQGKDPVNPAVATWKTWVLTAPDALRPPAPPTWDSPELKAELAELKAIERTPKIKALAMYWEAFGGMRAYALWNEHARRMILEQGLADDPPAAARALALLNIATYDAMVACWDAKYTYWQIRPPQLDSDFKSLFPPPNHPSYPAAHGCLSTAAATTLARLFPSEAEAFLALGRQAADARMWAGIHYRSDIEAGQALGQAVADQVLARALTPAE
jgi:membrane-associated phospholipid phosphatase